MFQPTLLLSGATLALLGLAHGVNVPSSGSFEPGTKTEPQATRAPEASLAWGDVDGDGRDDVLVVDALAGARLMLAFEAGRFEDVTEVCGLGRDARATAALVTDLDGDGDADLVLGSAATRVWRNRGDGTFEPTDSGLDHDHVDLAILALERASGRPDLQVRTEAGDLVYRNLGDGRFERVELPLVGAAGSVGLLAAAPLASPGSSASSSPIAAAARVERRLERWVTTFGPGASAPSSSLTTSSTGSLGSFLGAAPCAGALTDAAGGPCIDASSVPALGSLYPLSENLYVDPSTGFVGIGTTSPSGHLNVVSDAGDVRLLLEADTDNNDEGDHPGITILQDGGFTRSFIGYAASENDLKIVTQTLDTDIILNAGGSDAAGGEYDLKIDNATGVVSVRDLTLTKDVGDVRLILEADTDNDDEGDHPGITLLQDGGITRAFIGYAASENDLKIVTQTAGTDIILNAGGAGAAGGEYDLKIDNATGLVSVKESLEIRGGADIVERFESSCGELEPGTVVVIDPENPGQLACSYDAYDTKVAGVVSGAGGVNPGICLGQDGVLDGDLPVAMTGRVYVKCSAENGPIRPGDRLTTAALSGYAMKVTDTARADGAVIGKAMSTLDEGTGLVLVLVNLQ